MSTPAQRGAGREPAALRVLGRVVTAINRATLAASAAGVLVSLALIGWSVVMRYVFGRPPVWVDEMVGFTLVGIVMLAAAEVLRNGEHIGVDLLTAKLSGRAQLWARAWSSLSVLAVAVIFIVNGWESAMFSRTLGIVTEGHLEWPVYLLMLFLPLGGALLLLTAIESLARLAFGVPLPASSAHPTETE
ncbi:MAG TPA: TRAP transporter small permease subunit [Burkholderiaceae bacterium]